MDLDIISTPLGDLFIINILLFIDEPKIFTCKDENDFFYLAYFIDEHDEHDEWFFVEISDKRSREIGSGKISIKQVIMKPETQWVWKAFLAYDEDSNSTVKKIHASQIDENDLPEKDINVNLNPIQVDTDTSGRHMSKAEKPKGINEQLSTYRIDTYPTELPDRKNRTVEESVATGRDVLDLSLKINNNFSAELDLGILGTTLSTTQELLYLLDDSWTGRNKAPEKVRKRNALNVTTLFAASFGIRIKSQTYANDEGFTETSGNLERFLDLINSSKNTDLLEMKLKMLKPKAGLLFKELLKIFNEHQIEPKIELANPNSKYQETKLTSIQIYRAVSTINYIPEEQSEVLEVQGTLVGLALLSRKFEFKTDSGEHFSGKIITELDQDRYQLPIRVSAKFLMKSSIKSLNGKQKVSYELLEMLNIE
ncbi:hypothetical protein QW71_09745 [Paenibacillus sp. IHB B 3415]|uniref:DUF6575 domain-containing protein n=1 Tax=Paenibacillus sp. IHB B 3415 TaxID=867080 RepID=UPI000575094F|nr:DUF6575 domain-containing protein [Paenibacillus sp. IHB B 3415]KHL95881.1 hypothetical protein QW71_09745 [Paenibacillus sp. IHB B 3415]